MKIQQTRIDEAVKVWNAFDSKTKLNYRFGQHLFNYLDLHKSNDRDKVCFDQMYEIKGPISTIVFLREKELIDYGN